jgi:predicted DNA-binding transcriptional regulator AlpA
LDALRLPHVLDVTGPSKTWIEQPEERKFRLHIKMPSRSVAWIEQEVHAWLAEWQRGWFPSVGA